RPGRQEKSAPGQAVQITNNGNAPKVSFCHRAHHQKLRPKEVQNGRERRYDPNQGVRQRQEPIYSGSPIHRSEERRVGKEGRSRWWRTHYKKREETTGGVY